MKSKFLIKLRPDGGFSASENLLDELRAQGVDGSRFSKEELLFLATEDTVKKGFTAYVNTNAYTQELLAGVAAALHKLR